jgi:hypothetical protein
MNNKNERLVSYNFGLADPVTAEIIAKKLFKNELN